MFSKRCERCGAGYLSPVESEGLCELCEAGESCQLETYEVCRDCFDVFAWLVGAADLPDTGADHAGVRLHRATVSEFAAGSLVGLPDESDVIAFSRCACDVCGDDLGGARFPVEIGAA